MLRRSRAAVAGAIVLVIAFGGVLVAAFAFRPSTPDVAEANPTPLPSLPSIATVTPTPATTPSAAPTSAPPDPLLGLDGRFTVLLLGSDYRGSSPGNRTDTIMIVSIVPNDGAVAVVSIPRDTARFPLPDGSVYPDKINGLYAATVRKVGRDAGGTEFRHIIGTALGVEIDAYALIGMTGLVALIDQIGGVDVQLDAPVRDPYYWTNSGTQGIFFPAGKNHLNGERALIFARTRKGDSDFQRVRRQQQLVEAAVAKVLSRGVAALPPLVDFARNWIRTDLRFDQAGAIFVLGASADLDHARRAVLGPRYADPIPGSVNYQLRLGQVRALIADWFAPVPVSTSAPAASTAT
jgi:polyisoprenyl-teichoic acid--peptidoglycan teichoic acid transferase